MAFGLPARDEPNWDTKLDASINAVKATADAAQPAASLEAAVAGKIGTAGALDTALSASYVARVARVVRPEWFGAAADWADTSPTLGTGTDDTTAFQDAIDWLLATGGGVLELTGKYRIDGTVYINQTDALTAVPITIQGTDGNPFGSRGKGSTIVRTVSGDIFRVNLDETGAATLPASDIVGSFAVENVSIVGKSVSEGVIVTGINAFKAWRTRCAFRNIYTSRIDYLMTQPDTDAGALTNYCDQAVYENIRIANSTLGGLDLYLPDASMVKGIFFEGPTATAKHAIQAYGAGSLDISSFLFWTGPGSYTPVAGSSLIFLDRCRATRVNVLHVERPTQFEAVIDAFGCFGVEVGEVASYYDGKTFLLNRNSQQVRIDGWYCYEDREVGYYDIDIQGTTANNVDVTWRNTYFLDYSDNATRSILVNGATGQSDGALDGQPRPVYAVATDANYSPGRPGTFQLPAITATRTLTLPSARSNGTGPSELRIINRAAVGANVWSLAGASLRGIDGQPMTSLPAQSALTAAWDPVNSFWRVVTFATLNTFLGAGWMAAAGKTSAYTATDSDEMIRANASGGAFTVTLPTAASRAGKRFTIKKTDSSANVVTVGTTSSQTIDGATTYSLATQYKAVTVVSDGSNWNVIGAV